MRKLFARFSILSSFVDLLHFNITQITQCRRSGVNEVTITNAVTAACSEVPKKFFYSLTLISIL